MNIHFLGTSSASVTIDRDNTSLLVESGPELLLFDCGGNAAGKLLRLGFNPNNLNAVFITHLHIDHCYGLPALLFHMYLQKRTAALDIYCPEEELDIIAQQLQSHGIDRDVRTYAIHKKPVPVNSTDRVYHTDHVTVYPGPAQHSRATRAYKVCDRPSGRSMVFTGDTTPLDDMAVFAENTHLLIHEATYLENNASLAAEYGHSTAAQAARIAAKANAGALALVHFECPPECSIEDYRTEAALYFKGPIHTPHDLACITV
jgi:ribonuclease Z